MHLVGGRIVLDQFDQLVAEHDLAARCGDGFADDEIAGRDGAKLPADTRRIQSLQKFCQPRTKLLPPLSNDLPQHFRIGRGKIGRRHHVQHLPDRELDDRLVLLRHAAHARGRVVPPLFAEQKGLRHQIERRLFPLRPAETLVLRLRLDQRPRSLPGREETLRGFEEALGVDQRFLRDLDPPLWRGGQMRQPVRIGQQQRSRRNAAAQASQHGMQSAVGLICLDVFSAFRQRRDLRFDRRDRLPVLALARDSGANRQDGNFRRRQGRFLLHVTWPISSERGH